MKMIIPLILTIWSVKVSQSQDVCAECLSPITGKCDSVATCFADPCDVTDCTVSGARCTANYCGGCHAIFTDPTTNTGLTSAECQETGCDCYDADGNCANTFICLADPCSVATCSVEGATCTADYCGGCNAEWRDSEGVVLTDTQCGCDCYDSEGNCENTVQCIVDPCSYSSCSFEGAECATDYCGGCNAIWTDTTGRTLTDAQCAGTTTCPDGECVDPDGNCARTVACVKDPCELSSCPLVTDATCTANYCGGCNAVWTDTAKAVLTDTECGCNCYDADGNCANTEVNCFADPCNSATCSVEGATCTADYCGGCNAEWTDTEGVVLTDDACAATTETPTTTETDCECGVDAAGNCMDVECLADPCDSNPCQDLQECTADYCGGCNYICTDCDDCITPEGTCSTTVECLVNPCDDSSCSVERATCTADYCGGCSAVWKDSRGAVLTDAECARTNGSDKFGIMMGIGVVMGMMALM